METFPSAARPFDVVRRQCFTVQINPGTRMHVPGTPKATRMTHWVMGHFTVPFTNSMFTYNNTPTYFNYGYGVANGAT